MGEVLFLELEPYPLEQNLPPTLVVRRSELENIHVTRDCALFVVSLPRESDRAADAMRRVTLERRQVPLLALVPQAASEGQVPGLLQQAEDFAFLPVSACELRERIARLLAIGPSQDSSAAIERLHAEQGLRQLVGEDPQFLAVLGQIPRLAQSEATVLIEGASGTGKELVARAIHHLSPRRSKSFIAVDCGAFPDHLVENELFGHVPGAYTDARHAQRGLVSLAAGGTLFLDEIDSLSVTAQAKLLRFVQERTFKPLGSDRFEKVDIKIIAATNRDLARSTREGRFRHDLYYRLNVLTLKLAPLCERRGDIPVLARHFARTLGTREVTCSPAALRILAQYDWPGNIRELQNVIHRALVACDGCTLQVHHLNFGIDKEPAEAPNLLSFRMARAAALAIFERSYITELLRKHHGNVTRAALDAGKDRRALGRLIKKHRIDRIAG